MEKRSSIPRLIMYILVAELAGGAGAFFVGGNISTWYATLMKPFFSPPNWLFGPVWTVLYALMGVSAYLVWKEARDPRSLRLYWIQLFLNAIWTPIFFGLHSPLLGLITILALLATIIMTMKAFNRVNRTAFMLLIPYVAWVSFATVLNFSIFYLNQ